MSSPLKYTPLDPEAEEIRILTLLPSDTEDNDDAIVCCMLQIVSLRDSPKYEALSYVWGDPTVPKGVMVDGQRVQVTVNLENALRRLRCNTKRQLWVNAICIDQSNNAEKETQLPLMGKIYIEASSVLMWLGHETRHSKALFSWAHERHGWQWRAMDQIRYGKDCLVRLFPRERCKELLEVQLGELEIFSLPYWNRMWTFQEAWLAKRDPIVICGSNQCPAGVLVKALDVLEKTMSSYFDRKYFFLDLEYQQSRRDFVRRFAANRLAYPTTGSWQFRMTHQRRPGGRLGSIGAILRLVQGRTCTLDHDRVYSLFGCVPGLADACSVGYDRPFEEVMHEFANFVVKHNQLSTALETFHLQQDRLGSIPSWVPDIRHLNYKVGHAAPHQYLAFYELSTSISSLEESDLHAGGFGIRHLRDHNAISLAGWILGPCKILIHLGHDIATVLGQIIDLLSSLTPMTGLAQLDEHQLWQHALNTAGNRDRIVRTALVLHSNSLWVTALSLAFLKEEEDDDAMLKEMRIFYDGYTNSHSASSPPSTSVLHTYAMQSHAADSPQPTDHHMIEALQRMLGKTLFSVEGRLGVGNCDIEDGDMLMVTPALTRPFVVRCVLGDQDSVPANPSEDCYRLISGAYLDGLMDNEWEDNKFCQQLIRQPVKTVTIY